MNDQQNPIVVLAFVLLIVWPLVSLGFFFLKKRYVVYCKSSRIPNPVAYVARKKSDAAAERLVGWISALNFIFALIMIAVLLLH